MNHYIWHIYTESNFLVIKLNGREYIRLDKNHDKYTDNRNRTLHDLIRIGGEFNDPEGILDSYNYNPDLQ